MPRSAATCAIGRPDSKTSLTARSRSSSEYLRGRGIDRSSTSSRTDHPGLEVSAKPSLAHTGERGVAWLVRRSEDRRPSWLTRPRVEPAQDARGQLAQIHTPAAEEA